MFKTTTHRIANVALRAVAAGSKFVLIFALARLLEPADLGMYGLFAATVAFGILLVGGDYYTYAQRELLSVDRYYWSFVLQHQAIATALLYLVLLPAQLALFLLGMLPVSLAAWYFLLLVSEHFSQEVNRLLVAMGRPLTASWILFIRISAWVWPLLGVMWMVPQTRTLGSVFVAWLVGSTLASIGGMLVVVKEAAPWQRWRLDVNWLKRGFRVGLLFLAATLSFKALTTADRYLVETLVGPDLLGVYVFYIGIAMAVANILDPAVFSFLYPRVVGAYRMGERSTYQRLMKELAWTSIALSLGLAGLTVIAAPIVLRWIGRPIYIQHLPLLWILLSMAVVHVIGMVPHYGLYARGADKAIVVAHITSLIVSVTVVASLAPYTPFHATAYGLLAGFLWMGGVKLIWYRRLARNENVAQHSPTKQARQPCTPRRPSNFYLRHPARQKRFIPM